MAKQQKPRLPGDSFQYTIIDDCGGTATATVTLDVIR